MEEYDAIVLGGGLNGLAISSLLVKSGMKVLVLEHSKEIGGRVKTRKRGGFILDNSARNLIKYGEKSRLVNILNYIRDRNEPSYKPIPINHYYLHLGDTSRLKPNLHERLHLGLFKKGWITVPRTLNEMRKSDYFSAWNLMRIFTTGFKCEYNDIKQESVASFCERMELNEQSFQYMKLAAAALMHCSDVNQISAGEVIRTIKWSSKMPVLFSYPRYGWKDIINRFKKVIERNGNILTSVSDEKIIINTVEINGVQKYKISGISCSEGEFLSKFIIFATPPCKVIPILKKNANNIPVDKILSDRDIRFFKEIEPTSGISFSFGLNSQVYRGKGMFYCKEPCGYGVFLSNIVPFLAPAGKQLVSAFFPLCCNEDKDDELIKKRIDECRQQIFSLFPKIPKNLEFEEVHVHKVVDSVMINTRQFKDARPGPKVENVKGLFLTGDYLNSFGAGKELAFNSVWDAFIAITDSLKKENESNEEEQAISI